LPLEEQIEYAKDEFEEIMATEQKELDLTKTQIPLISRYSALKNKLVHLFLSGQYTQSQIARILNVSPSAVYNWLSSPEVKKAIEAYQQEEDVIINSSLKALRSKAIQKASELMDADNEMVASIMVRDVLDRTGHKAAEKKQVDINMTYEQRIQMLMNDEKEVDKNIENVDYTINGESSNEQINTEGDVSK
jgi:predicted transcriptional regulator